MNTASLEPVGVAGCGRMGAPMLRALRRRGFDAVGFDVRPAADFGDLAPHMVADPRTFAQRCRTVLTVVRDVAQSEALLFDDQALLAGPNAIDTLLVCSTLSPRWVRALRDRVPARVTLVDAPMSGAAVAAEASRLTFMLGGDAVVLDRLQPLLDAMGARFHRVGPFGAGITAKVLNNVVAASSVVATRTVLDWADRLQVDRRTLLEVMADSSGQTWFGTHFDAIEFARDGYSTDNTIGILAKDVASALDAVADAPGTALAHVLIEAIRRFRPID